MYDWVTIQFDANDDSSLAPAKVVLIFKDVKSDQPHVLVWGAQWRNKDDRKRETFISSRWRMEFDATGGRPTIRKVNLVDIVDVVYVVEHQSGMMRTVAVPSMPVPKPHQDNYCIDVITPRREWAEKFGVSM